MVRLDESEVAEVAAAFRKLGREDLALQTEKSRALRAPPTDATILIRLLGIPSDRVKEWALRGLGEHPGDKRVATQTLVQIVCDGRADEMSRALAVRVLGTMPMDSETVTKLLSQVGSSGRELSALLLEVVGSAGEAAEPVVPALRKFLNAREALVQYYAFEAFAKTRSQPGYWRASCALSRRTAAGATRAGYERRLTFSPAASRRWKNQIHRVFARRGAAETRECRRRSQSCPCRAQFGRQFGPLHFGVGGEPPRQNECHRPCRG
jgi:hypothetical protein